MRDRGVFANPGLVPLIPKSNLLNTGSWVDAQLTEPHRPGKGKAIFFQSQRPGPAALLQERESWLRGDKHRALASSSYSCQRALNKVTESKGKATTKMPAAAARGRAQLLLVEV